MRALTGTDITGFYSSHSDLLVLTADGEFEHLDADDFDGPVSAYDAATTTSGSDVLILLDRETIASGDWFADADDDDDGALLPEAADQMAEIINEDGIIPVQVRAAIAAEERRQKLGHDAALYRAQRVAVVVALCGGNQSEAARLLGIDQAAVNRLVRKARLAAGADQ